MAIQQLISKLNDTLRNIESLTRASKKQLESLQRNDLVSLNQAIQEQNVLFKEFATGEKDLLTIQENLVREMKLQEFSIHNLRDTIEELQWVQLESLYAKLEIKIFELKQVNELNSMLVKQNMAYVQNMMQTINSINQQANNLMYSQKGQVKKEEISTLLNQRV